MRLGSELTRLGASRCRRGSRRKHFDVTLPGSNCLMSLIRTGDITVCDKRNSGQEEYPTHSANYSTVYSRILFSL
jgi:hypothetical protein